MVVRSIKQLLHLVRDKYVLDEVYNFVVLLLVSYAESMSDRTFNTTGVLVHLSAIAHIACQNINLAIE